MKAPTAVYKERRQRLCDKLGTGKILFLGNNHSPRNFKSNYYPFRQDSSFLYYFGLDLPNLNAIIDVDNHAAYLFGDNPTIDDIVWIGDQENLESMASKVGVDKVLSSSELDNHLSDGMHYLPPYTYDHTLRLRQYFKQEPAASLELIHAVIEQRSYKSDFELAQLEKAVEYSTVMHTRVMQHCKLGLKESDLVGIANQVAYEHETVLAYQPILTTQGQILHTNEYHHVLEEGDLVLFDGGLEVKSGYCADLTRTFPASGKFTPLQKEVYNTVATALEKAVNLAGPGVAFQELHLASARMLVEGMKAIGWMKGNTEDAVTTGAHTMFFQCGLGHMLGLDVHDMENLGEQYVGYAPPHIKSTEFGLKSLRLAKALEPNNCITIEPGIYVIPQLIDKFRAEGKFMEFINYDKLEANRNFGGIRIEDNFVVTKDGVRNFGPQLPTQAEQIENLVQESLYQV